MNLISFSFLKAGSVGIYRLWNSCPIAVNTDNDVLFSLFNLFLLLCLSPLSINPYYIFLKISLFELFLLSVFQTVITLSLNEDKFKHTDLFLTVTCCEQSYILIFYFRLQQNLCCAWALEILWVKKHWLYYVISNKSFELEKLFDSD